MITIWGRRNSSNVQKAMWSIGEMGLSYQRHNVGGSFGQLDSVAYRQMNPNQRVPVLQDGDLTLWESNAVVRYLGATYGEGTLWPSDTAVRAIADQWMEWNQSTVLPLLTIIFMDLIRNPPQASNRPAVEDAADRLGNVLGILDTRLRDNDYVAGDEFTMGDIPLGICSWRYFSMDIERPSLPHVEAWFQRLLERPAYRTHVAFPFGATRAEWDALEQAGADQNRSG